MSLRRRSVPCAAAALLAVAAYALPMLVTLAADVSHGAHHLADRVQKHRRLAAELGLVHTHEAGAAKGSTSAASLGRFVHSHGGAAHSHDAPTDALLIAAAQADETDDEDRVQSTVQLLMHVPAPQTLLDPGPTPAFTPAVFSAFPTSIGGTAPTPPPPRA